MLRGGQLHWAALRSSSPQTWYVSRSWCAHGGRAPLLSYWCFITRRCCWCRRRPFDRPVLLSLPVGGWRDAKMALDSGDEIGMISRQSVANTLGSRKLNLGLRYLIVGI